MLESRVFFSNIRIHPFLITLKNFSIFLNQKSQNPVDYYLLQELLFHHKWNSILKKTTGIKSLELWSKIKKSRLDMLHLGISQKKMKFRERFGHIRFYLIMEPFIFLHIVNITVKNIFMILINLKASQLQMKSSNFLKTSILQNAVRGAALEPFLVIKSKNMKLKCPDLQVIG